jgi:nucleoside-diphosphate kinase
MKQKRTFLKRSFCDSITESDLYIGNTINVFGRELKLIDYLSDATRNVLSKKTERFASVIDYFRILINIFLPFILPEPMPC